ncbi:MAG: FixH family protein [Alphaproteobacteria bacterium]|nr:FixH family protein [Alphaproteobacteria bacterium]
MTASLSAARRDKWIPWYFVAFFAVIAVIDGVFVTIAVRTQTGMVTEQAYEKGLAYDKILDKATAQSRLDIKQRAEFADGVLSWSVAGENGMAFENIKVTAHFFRPVQDGYDFNIELKKARDGMYEGRPEFPLPGAWTARLEATWQNPHSQAQSYSTKIDLIAP